MAASSQAQRNKAAVVKALSKYGKDPSAVIDIASDKIVWTINAPKGFYPFAGTQRGKKAVTASMGKIAGGYKFKSYKVVDAVADGDQVWTHAQVRLLQMPDKRPVAFDIMARWTLKNGKVTKYDEYFDTAGVLVQEGRIAGDARGYDAHPVHFRH